MKKFISKGGQLPTNDKEFYTPAEIAKHTGLTLEQVYQYEESGLFGTPYKVAGWRSYKVQAINKMIKNEKATSAPGTVQSHTSKARY